VPPQVVFQRGLVERPPQRGLYMTTSLGPTSWGRPPRSSGASSVNEPGRSTIPGASCEPLDPGARIFAPASTADRRQRSTLLPSPRYKRTTWTIGRPASRKTAASDAISGTAPEVPGTSRGWSSKVST